MKEIFFIILLIPTLIWGQKIKEFPYSERDWFIFNRSELSLQMIDEPEELVIESTPYQIVINGVITHLLYGKIDKIIGYGGDIRYIDWRVAFEYSMFHFHNDTSKILVSEVWYEGEENCICLNQLIECIFDSENKVYKNISLGDILKSKRLKKYELVFYNTINKQHNSVTYQHELVIYYKLRWNPLLKKHRETRKGVYMLSNDKIVL